jgi:hypothetical protein
LLVQAAYQVPGHVERVHCCAPGAESNENGQVARLNNKYTYGIDNK